MQTKTNQEYFAKLTVPQLKAILADFKAVGFSKSKKAELVLAVTVLMDGAHLDAMEYAASVTPIHTGDMQKEAVFHARMRRHAVRLETYARQNNRNTMTPKQRKRATKKLNQAFKTTNWVPIDA